MRGGAHATPTSTSCSSPPEEDVLERAPPGRERTEWEAEVGERVADRVERVVVVAADDHARGVEATRHVAPNELVDERLRFAVDVDHHAVSDAAQLVDRSVGGDHAVAQDHHRVADPLDLLEQVRREQHVDPELGAAATDQLEHLVALDGIEAVGRLVEQHELRIVGDRLGELDALALAGRHRADRTEALLAEPDRPERAAGAVGGVAVGETRATRRCGRTRSWRARRAGACGVRGSSRAGRAPRDRPSTDRGRTPPARRRRRGATRGSSPTRSSCRRRSSRADRSPRGRRRSRVPSGHWSRPSS